MQQDGTESIFQQEAVSAEDHLQDSTSSRHALRSRSRSIGPQIDHSLNTFVDFLLDRVPVRLIPLADRELLCHRFNTRLQQAKDQEIQLSELEIGDDCLPTWPGWNWDPESESVHAVIQERLSAATFSQDLSVLLRTDIIRKGTKKLNEALVSGIGLQNISFGLDLLPQWPQPDTRLSSQSDSGTPGQIQFSESGYFSRGSSVASSQTSTDLLSERGVEARQCDAGSHSCEHGSENVNSDHADGGAGSQDGNSKARERMEGDDDESDASSTDSASDDSSYDPAGYAALLPQTNIVHNIELIGASQSTDLIDMEVYLADDSDIDSIPEVELAIDREGYEHYFGSADAMDIELPESMTCTGLVGPSDSEAEDDGDEELTRNQEILRRMGLRHGWVNEHMNKGEQVRRVEELVAACRAEQEKLSLFNSMESDIEAEQQVHPHVHYESESDISEEGVTTDENEEENDENEEPEADVPSGLRGHAQSFAVPGEDEMIDETDLEFEDVLQIE